ncbi:MAG: hypothetical protein M1816_004342 [Peltula sp. TS41687]|nr:MAG: hypothetical protein M1816_004342 [Peltula sp. TS41687]
MFVRLGRFIRRQGSCWTSSLCSSAWGDLSDVRGPVGPLYYETDEGEYALLPGFAATTDVTDAGGRATVTPQQALLLMPVLSSIAGKPPSINYLGEKGSFIQGRSDENVYGQVFIPFRETTGPRGS